MFKHHKLKILHLEDLADDALFVERELQKSQLLFETKLVDTKPAFIAALENFNPDIILSDHSLPAFNSAEALAIMQKSGKDIPFILVTGNVSEEFAVNMMRAGASDYILKDRMQRLPNAVVNAFEKFHLKKLQKKHLDEVIASELLFKQAEKMAHFGTWKYNMVSGRATWSEETYRMLGHEPGKAEPSQQNFLLNIIAEDIDIVKHALEKPAYGSEAGTMEFRVMTNGQGMHYIQSQFMVERNEENEVVSITGFNHDITEAKLAEESLYRSNANLQTIFANTDTAFILIDADFRIQSYNMKAETLAGEQLNKSLNEGEPVISYFSKEMHKDISSIMNRVLNGNKINFEIDYPHKDGESRWFDVKWIPIGNLKDKKLGLMLSIADITNRKLAEIERERITMDLMQRNKDLQQFTYIVSHNLRSQLANILALFEVFKNMEKEYSSPEWRQMLQMLDDSCQKLDMVIRDLNNILEVKHNIKEITEDIDIATLVEQVKSSLSPPYNKELDLEYDFSEVSHIKGLKSYLYSIFHNLTTNSIKFRQEQKPLLIHITALKRKDHVELIFKDNGRGIDMHKSKDQVFGLYKRFHTDIDGKGMGLFMIKTQVEALGGRIDIESEVNKGTLFTIRLPL